MEIMQQEITTNTTSYDFPAIFLSHSGRQKFFTESLFHRLKNSNYNCFFDKETLPKGESLSEILNAIKHCRVAVVVLSEDFIKSFWPMLELEHLSQRNAMQTKDHDPTIEALIIYPIFFGIEPSDLTNDFKFKEWRGKWKDFLHKKEEHNFDIDIWPMALKKLKSYTGTIVSPQEKDDCYRFLDIVVQAIQKILPPSPTQYFEKNSGIHGRDRIAKEIIQHFKERKILGIYGIGGSGKTTVCKMVVDFYNKNEFCATSWWLQFPSKKGDTQSLLNELKSILTTLTNEVVDKIDQAMNLFTNKIKGRKIFLAIDNVWEWSIEYAERILAEIGNVSRVIVTGRSEGILNNLFERVVPKQEDQIIIHVPSLTMNEALDMMFHSKVLVKNVGRLNLEVRQRLEKIVQGCFFNGQCHPLLLDSMCRKLKNTDWSDEDDLNEYVMNLQHPTTSIEEGEEYVFNVLSSSFDDLSKELQTIFMDMVIFYGCRTTYNDLSMLMNERLNEHKLRHKLRELEHYGMWKLEEEEDDYVNVNVNVHDMYIKLAKVKATTSWHYLIPDLVTSEHFDINNYLGKVTRIRIESPEDVHFRELKMLIDDINSGKKNELKFVEYFRTDALDLFESIISCSEQLALNNFSFPRLCILSLGGGFDSCMIKRIDGLQHAAPNLVCLHLCGFKNLIEINDVSQLRKLQELYITNCPNLSPPHLGKCSHLKRLIFTDSEKLTSVEELALPPTLKELDLSYCWNLEDVSDIDLLMDLEAVHLDCCIKVAEIPYILSCRKDINREICSQLGISDRRLDFDDLIKLLPDTEEEEEMVKKQKKKKQKKKKKKKNI